MDVVGRNVSLIEPVLQSNAALLWKGSCGVNLNCLPAAFMREARFRNRWSGVFLPPGNVGFSQIENHVVDDGFDNLQAIDASGYQIIREGQSSGSERIALPVGNDPNLQEFFTGKDSTRLPSLGPNKEILGLGFNASKMDGVHGHFMSWSSTTPLVYPSFYKPTTASNPAGNLRFYDGGTLRSSNNFTTLGSTGEYFTLDTPFEVSGDPTGASYYELRDISIGTIIDTDTYIHFGGQHRIHTNGVDQLPGLDYLGILGGPQWGYESLIEDTTPSSDLDENFTIAQERSWFNHLNLDTRPVYVFYMLRMQSKSPSEWETDLQALINRTESAANQINSQGINHLIIIPHRMSISGLSDSEITTEYEEMSNAAYSLVSGNVAVFSLWEATDKVFFNGSSANSWIENNKWRIDGTNINGVDLTGPSYDGDLLSSNEVDFVDEYAAAFFARIMSRALESEFTVRQSSRFFFGRWL